METGLCRCDFARQGRWHRAVRASSQSCDVIQLERAGMPAFVRCPLWRGFQYTAPAEIDLGEEVDAGLALVRKIQKIKSGRYP